MAKLMILIALLVLAASMAEASIYRTTTVTTYETMDDNDQMPRKCFQEMKQARMDSCREFMRSGRTMMLRTIPRDEKQEQQQPPRECCSNLSDMSQDCRCPILEKMMKDMQQWSDGEQGRRQKEEMATRAERLPEMCGLRPQRCHIRQQPSFF